MAFQRISGVPIGDDRLERSPELIAKVREMVTSGELGHWLFVWKSRVNQPSTAAVAPIAYLHPVGWYMIVIRNNGNHGEPRRTIGTTPYDSINFGPNSSSRTLHQAIGRP